MMTVRLSAGTRVNPIAKPNHTPYKTYLGDVTSETILNLGNAARFSALGLYEVIITLALTRTPA